MVWQRMGLLDDAIREHLELKRRRGADPGEVAREQREALDPVPREPGALSDEHEPIADAAAAEAPDAGVMAGGVPEDMPDELADAVADEAEAGGSVPHGASAGETEELDMRAVLDAQDGDAGAGDGAAPAEAPGGPRAAPHAAARVDQSEEDSLEWEMPSDSREEAVPDEQEADEDVLEETPEFLRDTPEQERLWFEQRPPRDFDFDK
jgi:hypothetical protein